MISIVRGHAGLCNPPTFPAPVRGTWGICKSPSVPRQVHAKIYFINFAVWFEMAYVRGAMERESQQRGLLTEASCSWYVRQFPEQDAYST